MSWEEKYPGWEMFGHGSRNHLGKFTAGEMPYLLHRAALGRSRQEKCGKVTAREIIGEKILFHLGHKLFGTFSSSEKSGTHIKMGGKWSVTAREMGEMQKSHVRRNHWGFFSTLVTNSGKHSLQLRRLNSGNSIKMGGKWSVTAAEMGEMGVTAGEIIGERFFSTSVTNSGEHSLHLKRVRQILDYS